MTAIQVSSYWFINVFIDYQKVNVIWFAVCLKWWFDCDELADAASRIQDSGPNAPGIPAVPTSPGLPASGRAGFDHLDNLCKLMEQLGELRDQNSRVNIHLQIQFSFNGDLNPSFQFDSFRIGWKIGFLFN